MEFQLQLKLLLVTIIKSLNTLPQKFKWLYSKHSTVESHSSVQSLSCVQLFVTPWTAVCQASLSITNSQSLLKLKSIESVMPFNHLIFCSPLLLLPSIFPSIRIFSKESVLCIRWPKYQRFSFSHVLLFATPCSTSLSPGACSNSCPLSW